MYKSYKGKSIPLSIEEKALIRNFDLKPIEPDQINPVLLKSTYVPENRLAGFGKNVKTPPRIIENYEIVMFTGDGGCSVINQKGYPISRNDIRVQKPGDISYSYRYKSIYCIHFALTPDPNEHAVCGLLSAWPSMMPALNIHLLHSIIDKLTCANINRDVIAVKTSLWELIHYLDDTARRYFANESARKTSDTVADIKNYIEANYQRSITLGDLSRDAHLHPNYLHRIFIQNAGMTPLEYLTDFRLKKANELLLTTDYKISEIASACGFNTPSYFIRLFKRRQGVTPNEFRNISIGSVDDIL